MDIGSVFREHSLQLIGHQQDSGNFFTRVGIDLGPHLTDGFNGVHNSAHSFFRSLILQGRISLRPGADHDAFAVMGQRLINFFRNKRHVGMQQLHSAGQHGNQHLLGRCPGLLP